MIKVPATARIKGSGLSQSSIWRNLLKSVNSFLHLGVGWYLFVVPSWLRLRELLVLTHLNTSEHSKGWSATLGSARVNSHHMGSIDRHLAI